MGSFQDEFWEFVCAFTIVLRFIMVIFITLLFATLLSMLFVPQGTETWGIIMFNLSYLLPGIVVCVYFIWQCRRGRGRS